MNIAIIIDELDMGGAQHVVYELVKHIDLLKNNITIICTDGKVNSWLETRMLREFNQTLNIIFLKNCPFSTSSDAINYLSKIACKIKKNMHQLIITFELYKVLNKIRPEIIHAHQHGILATIWTILHNVPIITTIHTNPEATFPLEIERLFFILSIRFKINTLVAISCFNYELIKKYWRYQNIHCINDGIEIENYHYLSHEQFAFINVSRHDENKNQILILNAFYKLFNEDKSISMKLFLIGDGVCHKTLVQKTKEYDLENLVIFTGYIDSAKNYYAISDVYISSSHREGLSLSVLEAMASRLPIIATDVGGVRELALENGILINDNDEFGLFIAMKKLRDNKELRLAMWKKSIEIVRNYSSSEMSNHYCTLYANCLRK